MSEALAYLHALIWHKNDYVCGMKDGEIHSGKEDVRNGDIYSCLVRKEAFDQHQITMVGHSNHNEPHIPLNGHLMSHYRASITDNSTFSTTITLCHIIEHQ